MLGQVCDQVCDQETLDATSFLNVGFLALTMTLKVHVLSPIFQGRQQGLDGRGNLPVQPASRR